MALYWFLLLLPMLGAVLATGHTKSMHPQKMITHTGNKTSPLAIGLFSCLLVLVVGFRHEVGGDWFNYFTPIMVAVDKTWVQATMSTDPAYGLLTWIAANIGGGVYFVNIVCALVFVAGLWVYAQHSPQPWLTMYVAVPYLVIVVAMGYTRQGVAIGLAMIGMVALDQGRIFKFTWWLLIAALFHKSALILLPLAVFSGRKKWQALLGVLLVSVLMYLVLLAEYVDQLIAGYIYEEYSSSGAGIRIAMNALPATLFLMFRHRFGLTTRQKSFWTWMSLGALAFIVLLALSPSSTAVDRVALYWIPLQLFVWSRLPLALGHSPGTQRQWLAVVLAYGCLVQYVWLFYADNRYAWLPYQFYPWVWLWS